MTLLEQIIWGTVFAQSWEDPATAVQTADMAVRTFRAIRFAGIGPLQMGEYDEAGTRCCTEDSDQGA